jgi:hypothetical protein
LRFLIPPFIRDIHYQINAADQIRFENLFKPWYCSNTLHAHYLQITHVIVVLLAYSNYIVAHHLFIESHPPHECIEDLPVVPWLLSAPVSFMWNKPPEKTLGMLLWKQLHTYWLHAFADSSRTVHMAEILPESQLVLLKDEYFTTDEARMKEPLILCDSFEGDVPPYPGTDDQESYKWEDVFPGPPPCPNNFNMLDNETKHLYSVQYYRPDRTFMTTAEQRVVNMMPMAVGNEDKAVPASFDFPMASPTWGKGPPLMESSGNAS